MEPPSQHQITPEITPDTDSKKKSNTQSIFLTGFLVVVGVVVLYALFISFSAILSPDQSLDQNAALSTPQNSMGERKTRMGLTSFDAGLAKKFMDKDNDGKCDACGMPVEMCMDSGQLQCNMDSESTIGDLGSQHVHADLKVYLNGKVLGDDALESLAMDMSKKDNLMTSSFIHLDKGAPAPEKTGDVLHMHATGVPLWIWFESVGWKLDKDCLKTSAGKYCTNAQNSLKFYVNEEQNSNYGEYVFNDLDQILISYGPKDEEVRPQLNSITDFAVKH